MYLINPPRAEISHLVESFRYLSADQAHRQGAIEFFPDGHFSLGFALGSSGLKILVGGPNPQRVKIPVESDRDYFLVRFRPGKLPRFSEVAPSDLAKSRLLEPPRLFGVAADVVAQSLQAAGSPWAKQAVIERLLQGVHARATYQDKRCRAAVEMVDRTQGRILVSRIAEELGLSRRTLERIFREQVGLPPRQFIRNVRFQKVLTRIKLGPSRLSHTFLAHEFGYVDHSHLIKEFRALAQRPPGAFRSCRVNTIQAPPAAECLGMTRGGLE